MKIIYSGRLRPDAPGQTAMRPDTRQQRLRDKQASMAHVSLARDVEKSVARWYLGKECHFTLQRQYFNVTLLDSSWTHLKEFRSETLVNYQTTHWSVTNLEVIYTTSAMRCEQKLRQASTRSLG